MRSTTLGGPAADPSHENPTRRPQTPLCFTVALLLTGALSIATAQPAVAGDSEACVLPVTCPTEAPVGLQVNVQLPMPEDDRETTSTSASVDVSTAAGPSVSAGASASLGDSSSPGEPGPQGPSPPSQPTPAPPGEGPNSSAPTSPPEVPKDEPEEILDHPKDAAGIRDEELRRHLPLDRQVSGVLSTSIARSREIFRPSPSHASSTGPEKAATRPTDLPSNGEQIVAENDLPKFVHDVIIEFIFPLGLVLLVLAFLMIQHRLDCNDPKLARIIMDPEDSLLPFD